MSSIGFISREEEEAVLDAIRRAEKNTSGEIRVHFSEKIKTDILSDARLVFEGLKMHITSRRNGVLIYIVPREKQFAIIGDEGIDKVTEDNFWESVKNLMQAQFREGRMMQGIVVGIEEVAKVLKDQFPYEDNDSNELDDSISYEA